MQSKRGSINNRERAKQQKDYSGLLFGKITPTDIDGLIEYKNKAYVIIELKYDKSILPYGQRLALKRLIDDLEQKEKTTLLIIAVHQVHNCNEDIDVANTSVTEYRLKREWILVSPELKLTTRKIIELFLDNLEVENATDLLEHFIEPEPHEEPPLEVEPNPTLASFYGRVSNVE